MVRIPVFIQKLVVAGEVMLLLEITQSQASLTMILAVSVQPAALVQTR